jgi:hypothetical protein
MTKYFIGICIFILGTLWSINSFLYYAWLTATPLQEGYLELYQKLAMYWLCATLLLISLIVASIVRITILHKRTKEPEPVDSDNQITHT